ncbi:Ig-like domain-containing protein [Lacrimispora sp.]|uniref:Ig-like domain-containing protein n=1 Tax=Lacrimispora sp. TaxID=2719234 RepID=UPI0028A735F8|nr:Ig-like domain-containing protein [Lacrimispora sp.]
MKKVTKSIFLIALLVMMTVLSMTAYAEPEDEVRLDYQINVGDSFKLYISESDEEVGELINQSSEYRKIISGNVNLKPGKTYYLHVEAYTSKITPSFSGKFVLNGDTFKFNNNSNILLTNPVDFKAFYDKFGGTKLDLNYQGSNDYSVPGTKFIGTSERNIKYNTVYFSTPIIAKPVLSVQAASLSNSVILTWNTFPGATSYSIERSNTPGGPYAPIASDLIETNYTDKSVTANTTYYYVVKAKLSDTETVTSSEVSGTPTNETPTIESKLKVVLEPTESLQLSVDDNLAINTNMTWTSSDNTVATVNEKGVVTALAPGNTVITVKSPDDTYTDYINVLVVEDASDYRLAIDLKVGQSARLTVDDLTNTVNATWEPMDSAIANVTSKGKVTALKKGLVLFTAKDEEGNVIGKVYVRVRE